MRVWAVAGVGAYLASVAVNAAGLRAFVVLGGAGTFIAAMLASLLAGALVAGFAVRREPEPARAAALAVGAALSTSATVAALAVLSGLHASLPFHAVYLAGAWGLAAVPVAILASRSQQAAYAL